jgi:hypothetical protein
MYESNDTTTVAIKPCRSCGAGLIDAARFCRSCGAAQGDARPPYIQTTIPDAGPEPVALIQYATTKLSELRLYHPVSGPLVNAVAAGVPVGESLSPARNFSKRMLLALMAVPIWLMIILLSPLDAYASAKIIGNRI